MNFKQKDIVLLPYPFSDLKRNKIRPGIIISKDEFNISSNDYLMMPLTTVIKNEPYSINIIQNDLSSGKLIRPSRIKIDKLFCVEKKIIIKKIGTLNDVIFDNLCKKLINLFDVKDDKLPWLKTMIKKHYGKKCKDYKKDCGCCQAWDIYDAIVELEEREG